MKHELRKDFTESVKKAQKGKFKKLMKKSIKEDARILKVLAGHR